MWLFDQPSINLCGMVFYKDRDTIFYLRGPWANRVRSKARQNLAGGLGILPRKNLRQRPSDLLATTPSFVLRLTFY